MNFTDGHELQDRGKVHVAPLPRIVDPRGNLTFVEAGRPISFPIRRAYWIYDVPGGEMRGGHAYKSLHECVIAMSGSFDVAIDDGSRRFSIALNRSYHGLIVPKLVWRRLENFSTNAVCLILASDHYDAGDYIRDYSDFLAAVAKNRGER